MKEHYAGIDYGGIGSATNRNIETGIRYGVIGRNSISPECLGCNDVDEDYGPPTCPKCGNQADKPEEFGETFKDGVPEYYTSEKYESDDYVCENCKHFFGSESAFGDESCGWSYDKEGYQLTNCLDNDIFVIKSPYYTYAQFCSPCVPGAGNLDNPFPTITDSHEVPNGGKEYKMLAERNGFPKTYCLGYDFFDEYNPCPYPMFSVKTKKLITPPQT